MIIETQTYVTNVTFSKSEAQVFRNLSDIMEKTCHNRDDCNETCPFHICGGSCGDVSEFLLRICAYLTEDEK
jgi:MinD superfamily P-loop ATPase